jgi:hypothetical protein
MRLIVLAFIQPLLAILRMIGMVAGLNASKQVHKTFVKDTEFWDQTLGMGAEGLIATIESHQELLQALNTLKCKEITGMSMGLPSS